MIGKLKGIVDSVGEEEAVIDVNGVGYLIHAGARTLSRLSPGAAVSVHVETYVREDALKLFAFLTDAERAWFVRLQSVQGVGARHALAMLDAIAPGEIESAAALGDTSAFSRAKGVGPKLAQRIAAELKDKAPPAGRTLGGGRGAGGVCRFNRAVRARRPRRQRCARSGGLGPDQSGLWRKRRPPRRRPGPARSGR